MQGQDLETALRVPKPDGSFQMSGCVLRGVTFEVENSDTNDILPGDVVVMRAGGATHQRSQLGRWDTGNSDRIAPNAIRVLRGAAASDVMQIGIALEPIPAGAKGEIASLGSIVMARHDGLTTASLGVPIGVSSAGDGSVSENAVFTDGTILGMVVISNGTGAGQSGSITQVGVLINPR